jgi:hypothetical protein
MKNGGTMFPVAETARTEVANSPRSVDTSLPVCNHGAQQLCQVSARLLYPFRPCSIRRRPNPQKIQHLFRIIKNKH